MAGVLGIFRPLSLLGILSILSVPSILSLLSLLSILSLLSLLSILSLLSLLSILTLLSDLSLLQKKEPLAGLQQTSKGARSGDSNLFREVDVLNGVEELGALFDGTLEGLATRDETLSASALVDDGGLGGLGEVVGAGGAARVD